MLCSLKSEGMRERCASLGKNDELRRGTRRGVRNARMWRGVQGLLLPARGLEEDGEHVRGRGPCQKVSGRGKRERCK